MGTFYNFRKPVYYCTSISFTVSTSRAIFLNSSSGFQNAVYVISAAFLLSEGNHAQLYIDNVKNKRLSASLQFSAVDLHGGT